MNESSIVIDNQCIPTDYSKERNMVKTLKERFMSMELKSKVNLKNVILIAGLTALSAALLSVNFSTITFSSEASKSPIQLVLIAFVDTLLLSYFVVSSRWGGWKQWGAVFAVLYGMVYILTAIESVYLGSLLSANTVFNLLLNGAIISVVFSGALVLAWKGKATQEKLQNIRLQMDRREWVWKVVVSAAVYLLLFMVFGLVLYMPLGKALDPAAFAQEQSTASAAGALVFPVELIRGALWALLAVPAIMALPFGWKKTGVIVGLLLAVPLALTQFLATSMTVGLQIAHCGEIFGENLVFGMLLLWILHMHSRLPAEEPQK